jgi:hypothetical protein
VYGRAAGGGRTWARANNLDAVHGPLGLCGLDKEGMMTTGTTALYVYHLYNFPFYPRHQERHDYGKADRLLEYEIKCRTRSRADRGTQLAARKAAECHGHRSGRKKVFRPFATAIFALLNDGYKICTGLSPVRAGTWTSGSTQRDYPDYLRVVSRSDRELVAFGIAIPSLAKGSKAKGACSRSASSTSCGHEKNDGLTAVSRCAKATRARASTYCC